MSAELLNNQILTGLKFGGNFLKPKSKPKESSTPDTLTPLIESTIEDVRFAVQAADSLARSSGKTVVIQEDLSVVYKKDVTKRILETVRSV